MRTSALARRLDRYCKRLKQPDEWRIVVLYHDQPEPPELAGRDDVQRIVFDWGDPEPASDRLGDLDAYDALRVQLGEDT